MRHLTVLSVLFVLTVLVAPGCSEPAADSSQHGDSDSQDTTANDDGPPSADYLAREQAVRERMQGQSEQGSLDNINKMLDAAESGNGRPTAPATSLEDVERRKNQIRQNNAAQNIETILDAAD